MRLCAATDGEYQYECDPEQIAAKACFSDVDHYQLFDLVADPYEHAHPPAHNPTRASTGHVKLVDFGLAKESVDIMFGDPVSPCGLATTPPKTTRTTCILFTYEDEENCYK